MIFNAHPPPIMCDSKPMKQTSWVLSDQGYRLQHHCKLWCDHHRTVQYSHQQKTNATQKTLWYPTLPAVHLFMHKLTRTSCSSRDANICLRLKPNTLLRTTHRTLQHYGKYVNSTCTQTTICQYFIAMHHSCTHIWLIIPCQVKLHTDGFVPHLCL
jgi:hypothetical protein